MKQLTLITCLLALVVIVLGAYTRLTDAGLGCPDWPGCYGHWTVPAETHAIQTAEQQYQQTIEPQKAWTEMTHRYIAGTLGLCIFAMAIVSLRQRRQTGNIHRLPWVMAGLVIFQALLGMWTVTLKLMPVIILLHLLGGFTLLSLLWWYFLTQKRLTTRAPARLWVWTMIGIGLLLGQIILGGLTSAHYAALICPDFPYCQGSLLPTIHIMSVFDWYDIAREPGSLISIHMVHRLGALVVTLYWLGLAGYLIWQKEHLLRKNGLIIVALLATQVTLGILNIVWLLPLVTAVSHNLVAALLLLSTVTLLFLTTHPPHITSAVRGGI